MNDLLKTFVETANRLNFALSKDRYPDAHWVQVNEREAYVAACSDEARLVGASDCLNPEIYLTSDHASADAIIVILDAIRARGYTVQILTFADSVAEPEERFQVFAWRSLNEHRKGPNDGNSAAGPTLIGCAVEVYNAIHASEEANS